MRTYLLEQPDGGQMATFLRAILKKCPVMKFRALVAFAVTSGVVELKTELESLLAHGGSIEIVVGVSHRVTTAEGLALLLELAHKGAKVYVFHNDNAAEPVFHPKVYICVAKDSAVLIVGSNNMTGKGLIGNYEISLVQELDLNKREDLELLNSAENIMAKYCDVTSGFSRALDDAFLRSLEEEGYLGSEARKTNWPETTSESESPTEATVPRKKLFSSERVPRSKIARRATSKAASTTPQPKATEIASVSPSAKRGALLWEKRLAASDVQSQPGHPTGVIRLTQAKWRVGGKLIDWTVYFRRKLFGGFAWKKVKEHPFVEETEIQVDVTILGVHVGVHRLKISDKPSGEAGQGNYTSSLHWGELGNNIKKAKLAGKILKLYAPTAGSNEPFFVEIT